MSESIISGYSGIFQCPLPYNKLYSHSPSRTMYILSDIDNQDTLIVLLSLGDFIDAYYIAKKVGLPKVTLACPCIGAPFISDINNTLCMISELKPNSNWIFPINSIYNDNILLENTKIISSSYINSEDSNLTMDYIENEFLHSNIYDIKIYDGIKSIYMCNYLTIEIADALMLDDTIDEVHIPYSSTLFGGLTYCQLIEINPLYKNKFKPNSFNTLLDYSDFINNSNVSDRVIILEDSF